MSRSRILLYLCLCVSLTSLTYFIPGLDAGTSAPARSGAARATSGPEGMPVRVAATQVVSQLTGRNSPNDTTRWGVHGTDLGHMIRHRGALYMVFGDTFGEGGFGGANWRSNTLAWIADPDPRNGFAIETMIAGPDGMARELIRSRKVDGEEKTIIPTNGISVGGRMHLHYMSVRTWGEPGEWDVGHSGIAYSDDDGRTWQAPEDAVWPENSGFEQVAFVEHEDALYSFGITEGRFGGVRLRRVEPASILQRDAYRYWDGERWVADIASAATIVPAPVGELSVAWSEMHRSWLMMYLDPKRHAIVLRAAPRLTGPWGRAQVVVTAEEYPGLYAPYMVPGSEIGTDLYYTMSRWDPYNVYLMRTTLEPATPAPALVSEGPAPAPSDVSAMPVSSRN